MGVVTLQRIGLGDHVARQHILPLLCTGAVVMACGDSERTVGEADAIEGGGGADQIGASGAPPVDAPPVDAPPVSGQGGAGALPGGNPVPGAAGGAPPVTDPGGEGGGPVSGMGGAPAAGGAGMQPTPADPSCDATFEIAYAPSGLPLLQSNPDAAVALYLDFDGGVYTSSDGDTPFGGYNRNDPADTFDAEEQADILLSWQRLQKYFAMFEVNVTTDDAARRASKAWSWILITEEISGGYASLSSTAVGTTEFARARVGSASIRDSDKSRRVAHEIGHNFTLEHDGAYVGDEFFKYEDWVGWDGVYGSIMGGGGEGQRNGWGLGPHSGSRTELQDSMDVIRKKLMDVGGAQTGWSKDDFVDGTPGQLCKAAGAALFRKAVLNHPTDVDRFALDWPGGDLTIEAFAPDVSAALLKVNILSGAQSVGGIGTTAALPAGSYVIQVESKGGYGEIGEYELHVNR